MVLMRLLILASKKKMLHKICITRKWSKKQMMFKDRNKNYRRVCASAKMPKCSPASSCAAIVCSNAAERMNNQPLAGGSSAKPRE